MDDKIWLRLIGTICLTILAVASSVLAVCAAEWSPRKSISYITTTGPGGGIDITMRGIRPGLSKYLGQPVIIKNMPGAGGGLAMNFLFRSAPDGHTIGCNDPVSLMGKEAELTVDYKFADFVMVGRVNARYYGLAVSTKSPYRSLADLQKAAAARPKGKPLRMGGIGLATANAVNATLALPMMKLPFTYVGGMKGSADAIVGCLRGDLDMLFYPCETYTEFVKSGDLRILFHTGPKRDKDFPDVPVVKELGYPELEGLAMSVVVMGPPRLPENIRAALEKALVKAGNDPETQAWSEKMKIPMEPLTQKEFEPVITRAKNLMKNYAVLLKQYESWQNP